jgi:class 3 adenylate cyclase
MQPSPVRYARGPDGGHIAYRTFGDGPITLVFVPNWVTNVDAMAEEPIYLEMLRQLGSFARIVMFDQRGTGLSDPIGFGDLPPLEWWAENIGIVLDDLGVERAALMANDAAGPPSILFAATHPERVFALLLVQTFARAAWAEDHEWGVRPEVQERFLRRLRTGWGAGALVTAAAGDPPSAEQLELMGRWERMSSGPGVGVAVIEMLYRTDVRPVLPTLRVPTLVVHRVGNRYLSVEHGRHLGRAIPGAQYVELPGSAHLIDAETMPEILGAIEEFLTGQRTEHPSHDRVLASVLFTDIVSSTETAAAVGDRAWTRMLDQHDSAVRRQLQRFGGREVNTTGDGFVAVFDGPGRAIACGAAITAAAGQIGLSVRAGVHTGECMVRGDDIAGMAVVIARRICDLANSGQVLVSGTVRDLVVGSEITFDDAGTHELKGVPGAWRLHAVTSGW